MKPVSKVAFTSDWPPERPSMRNGSMALRALVATRPCIGTVLSGAADRETGADAVGGMQGALGSYAKNEEHRFVVLLLGSTGHFLVTVGDFVGAGLDRRSLRICPLARGLASDGRRARRSPHPQ